MNLHAHSHSAAGHGHTHEILDHPGLFHEREAALLRDFTPRAFTVGVGGPVGSGKTALVLHEPDLLFIESGGAAPPCGHD